MTVALATAARAPVRRAAAATPTAAQPAEEIVVLDYGGQYSQLIARRVRDCGVFSELLPHHVPLEEIAAAQTARDHPLGRARRRCTRRARRALERGLLELGVPVLGICYGMQLLVHELGGRVEQAEVGEFGRSELHVSEPGVLLAGMPREQTCWMSHRDTVFEPPPGLHRAGVLERLAGRGGGGPRARHLRHPVPPRGRAHALRPGDPDALPDRGVRLRARPGRRRRSSRSRCGASASRSATAR